MEPERLVELFVDAAGAVAGAVGALTGEERLGAGDRPHQYGLDLVADEAALRVLEKAPVAVLSEESGVSGAPGSGVTVVLDPVDGSTNASRGIPYWSTSLAAVDGDGLAAAVVVNQVTGERYSAMRGGGAMRDGERIETGGLEKIGHALVAVVGAERVGRKRWAQTRTLGSAALELCEVAGGRLDGYLDGWGQAAPWDYLGALLVCREAGAVVIDHRGRELVVTDGDARRQLVAAGTPALLSLLQAALP